MNLSNPANSDVPFVDLRERFRNLLENPITEDKTLTHFDANIAKQSIGKTSKPFLTNRSELENLQSINGLSLDIIEERSRPYNEKTKKGYSMSGFIGADEKFMDVLKADWALVENLKTTHLELHDHIQNILLVAYRAQREAYAAKRPFGESFDIMYSVKDMKTNMLPDSGYQRLRVTLLMSRGFQEDIFTPLKDDKREVNTEPKWGDENSIYNYDNGVQININTGVLSYIRELGFYEGGGDKNRYRVDPKKIMAVLTGNPLNAF